MERFDNNKKFVFRVILTNCRLEAYKIYIKYALRGGYRVCSMEEFWRYKNSADKYFVLRHDIDHISRGTRRMFEAEKECGVTSTYYFRHSTIDRDLMNEMQREGFEVGLHYETLSDYADAKKLDRVSKEDIEKSRDILKKEIKEFNNLLQKKVISICSHGAPANKRIGCSNNVLLEGQDYRDYGIEFEAYDKGMYETCVDVHIMDGNICYNYGFSYQANPIDAVNEGRKHIIFLAHPNHWHQTPMRSVKDIGKILLGKARYFPNAEFLRIRDEHISRGEENEID